MLVFGRNRAGSQSGWRLVPESFATTPIINQERSQFRPAIRSNGSSHGDLVIRDLQRNEKQPSSHVDTREAS